jgi:hypothetical protein
MSQTSRIYSYASPDRQTSNTPQPNQALVSVHDDFQREEVEFGIARKNKRQRKLEKEEEMADHEAIRPPYIHV